MKKVAAALVLLLCMLFGTAEAALILEYDGAVRNYTGSIYELEVNGKRLTDLPLEPIIFNDRALVPVREIFEAMGATVEYEEKDKSVTITHGKRTVFLRINSYKAKVDNVSTQIPDKVTPKLIAKWGESAKTMVPVRFISESIGMDVQFDEDEGLISITDPEYTTPGENKLIRITHSRDDDIVEIRATAKDKITSMTEPRVTESGVIYTDIDNMSFNIDSRTEVKTGPVLAVRLGVHDQSTRIAVDTEDMEKYSVTLSSDKKTVIFRISGNADADIDTESNLPTDEPEPTVKPTRPAPNPGEIIVVLDAGHGGHDPGVVRNRFTEEEMEEWLVVKESPTPTPSSTPEASKSTDEDDEADSDSDEDADDDKSKESASPSPSSTPEPTIWDGGTGDMYKEKDIALSVTHKIKDILEDEGIKVVLTREGDTYPTLDERPALAEEIGASLFLSLHVNSTIDTVTTANGIEIYYSTQNNSDRYGITSEEFAEEILGRTISSTRAKERGVKTANYLVIRKGSMPSALIEMGFLNNPEEFELLISDEYQDKLANGIAKGIINSVKQVRIPVDEPETEDAETKNVSESDTEDEEE